jgi:hypothetical protein
MNEWQSIQKDPNFSFDELRCLSGIIAKVDKEYGYRSWTRIADKFFDVTGRRVHADDIRDMFGRLSKVAAGHAA